MSGTEGFKDFRGPALASGIAPPRIVKMCAGKLIPCYQYRVTAIISALTTGLLAR
jgi:hypothetical protein